MSESLADVVHEAVERAKADEERKPVTLTEFLLARIAEDEAVARAVKPLGETWDMGGKRLPEGFRHVRLRHHGEDGMPFTEADHFASDHFARWDPARVLAECEAKRRIVALCQQEDMPPTDAVLVLLAKSYKEHPDFDPSWRL